MITVYNKFLEQVNLGAIDLETDTIKCVLVDATYTIDRDHDFRNDVTGQIAGTTATVTGITVTLDNAIDKSLVDHDDVVYTSITCNPRYLVVYKDTGAAATDVLIYVLNFETTYTLTSDNLTIMPPVGGFLSYQQTETETNTDVLVKISSNDTTAGYLNGKLVASSEITFTEINDGSNETLSASIVSGSIDESKLDASVNASLDLADSALQAETDPVFTASQAFNIDAGDITNLSNLSGVNTGDQDLSSYLTSATAATTYAKLDGTNQPFTGSISATNLSGTNTGDQDLSGYVPYTGATGSVELGSNRIIIGGGIDDTVNDLQLNGSNSINFGTQITQGLSGSIFNFNNPAFAQADAQLNLWTQTDGTTAASDGDVLTWDDTNGRWAAAAPTGGGGGGVTTMGAFGSSPNGNGGTISGVTLTLQPADATNPGGVSTTTQSFLGTKTFLNTINYFNSSATSNTVFDGAILNNATAATSGNQQYSPALRYIGAGWKTNATAASQAVEFRRHIVPVQGAAAPTANLITSYAVNGGAFSTVMTQTSVGQNLGVSGSASAPTWGFSAQTNYGMYHASSWLRLAANGLDAIGITSLGLVHIGMLGLDSAALGVGNDKSGGYYVMRVRAHSSQSAEVMRFETSGASERAHLSSGYFWRVQDGSATTPAYSFLNDNDNGDYRIGVNNIGRSIGGTLRMDWTTTELNFADGYNFKTGTTTGTKIGTSTSQKIGFYNATPIVQITTGVASATFSSPGAGTQIKTDDTFDGYTIQQVVKALRNLGFLA